MKYHEKVKTRIDCGNYPQYETQKSKFLWVDDSIYHCPTNLEKIIPGILSMKKEIHIILFIILEEKILTEKV